MTKDYIRQELFDNAEVDFAKFTAKLNPNSECEILGVRTPVLKRLARQVAHMEELNEYLDNPYLCYHEEIKLYGLVVCYASVPLDQKLKYLTKWTQYIVNWEQCDIVACAFNELTKEKYREIGFRYLESMASGDITDFQRRFVIVCLMRYYLDDTYVERSLHMILSLHAECYYVKMAIAWAVSELLVKDFDCGVRLLQERTLDEWVQNKAIQKARESYRITPEQKSYLNTLKSKVNSENNDLVR